MMGDCRQDVLNVAALPRLVPPCRGFHTAFTTKGKEPVMYVIDQPAPAATPIPGVAHATLASAADGLSTLSVWRQSMAPGGCTPPHLHACEELVLCESGEGELHIGGQVHAFRGGQMLVLPAGVPHQLFNTGTQPLVSLAVFPASPVPVALPDGERLELPWRS
jgi:quercetin dioxygenase-like cupin family protein